MQEPFALFLDAQWQWVSLPMGAPVRTGIIRSELEASARLVGVTMTPALFGDIRTLEAAALAYWSRKR